MQVRELLKNKNRDVITAVGSMSITEAMELLILNQISSLPVINESGKLEGIVSDRDIFRAVYKDKEGFSELTINELMTKHLMVGLPDDDIQYIAGVMTKNRIRHVPIVEDDIIIGLVSVGDIVKAQLDSVEVENRYLKTYITGRDQG